MTRTPVEPELLERGGVRLDVNGLVATITLDRPEALNAWIVEVGKARGEDERLDRAIDGVLEQLSSTLQDRGDQIASGVFSGVSAVGSFVITLVLVPVFYAITVKDLKIVRWEA